MNDTKTQRTVSLTVINDLVTDQRLHKISTTLQKSGYKVILIGRKLPDSIDLQRDYSTVRLNLLFKRSVLFYAAFNFRLFWFLLFKKTDILVANDLDTLPANFLVSRLKNKPLVYDSHEYFTEVPELIHRKGVQSVWKTIEKLLLPNIKYAYTVCDSIAKVYNEKYKVNFSVIRNLPFFRTEKRAGEPEEIPELVQRFKFGLHKKIIIYQGAINAGRGVDYAIRAMQYVENAVLIIAGSGDLFSQMQQLTGTLKLYDKVIFTGRLPFSELLKITPYADVGISLEENRGLNYYYALPNKLFDYIQAKVPVLTSPFPEMKAIVEKYQIGLTIRQHGPKHIAEQLTLMTKEIALRKKWEKNLEKAARELCWEKEEHKLLQLFSSI